MHSCDEAIVTLQMQGGGFTADMEIPTFLPMEDLLPKLLESLRLMQPRMFGNVRRISLADSMGTLGPTDTLASRGIWDGAYLAISTKRKEGA